MEFSISITSSGSFNRSISSSDNLFISDKSFFKSRRFSLIRSSIIEDLSFFMGFSGVSDTILKTKMSSLQENADATSQNPKASMS